MTKFTKNKRIVVTRATHQADSLMQRIRDIGAIPVAYPCIAIAPPDDTTTLDNNLQTLATFDWLVLTSPNTVRIVQERLQIRGHQPDWSAFKIAVVGNKTAQVVNKLLGQTYDFIPDDFTADCLATTLPDISGKRVFIPQSALADDSLADALRKRHAIVTNIPAYHTVIGSGGEDVPAMLHARKIDLLTFTSSSTVSYFVQRIQPLAIPDVPALCIGPSTGATATQVGFRQVLIPDEYSLDGMIQTLIRHFEQLSLD